MDPADSKVLHAGGSIFSAKLLLLQIADQAVQRAGQRIIAAKQLSPDIPQIDLAIVRSMQGGIYMNLVSGTLSQCVHTRGSLPDSIVRQPCVVHYCHDALHKLFEPK